MAMVRVGGEMYDQNQMFEAYIDSVGRTKVNAVQMARLLATGGGGGQNASPYSMGNTTEAGMLQDWKMIGERIQEQKQAAPAAPAPRRSQMTQQAPAVAQQAPVQPVAAPITKEEKEEITKPASGLEDTIKTTPSMLRDRRRRSSLTSAR